MKHLPPPSTATETQKRGDMSVSHPQSDPSAEGGVSQPHQPWLGPVNTGRMGGEHCPQSAHVQVGTHPGSSDLTLSSWFLRGIVCVCTSECMCGLLWICMLYKNVHVSMYTCMYVCVYIYSFF